MSLHSKTLKILAGLIVILTIALTVTHSNAQSLKVSSHDHASHDHTSLSGSTYKPVASQFKVSTGDKIEVAELFWFGCGHCFALEPSLKEWKKTMPANAKFIKVPAIFSKHWEFHGKAFYTMQSLNVPEKAYDDFFQSIHVKNKKINNLDALVSLLEPYEKNEKQITSTFNSFEIDSKVRAAVKISKQSGATGVPAIIVDGKYLTTQSMTNGIPDMFKTVNLLVEKAAAER